MVQKTTLALALALSCCSTVALATENIAQNSELNFVVDSLAATINLEAADQVYSALTARQANLRIENGEGMFYVSDVESNLIGILDSIASEYNGQFGAVVFGQDGLILLRDNSDFPLMSTVKFHLAYAVAAKMQAQGHDLLHTIKVQLKDLDSETYSPIYDMIKEGLNSNRFKQMESNLKVRPQFVEKLQILKELAGTIPEDAELEFNLADLIYFSVALSDNNACDLLLTHYLNGPKELEDFLKAKGLSSAKIEVSEGQMSDDVELSYNNSMKLYDAAKALVLFKQDHAINVEVRECINTAMEFAPTGVNRIQAGVKAVAALNGIAEYKVFDKTGLGGMNARGERIAVNDLAYVSIQGKPYVVAIYAKDLMGSSDETISNGEKGIAKISEQIFSYLVNQK